jgi:hypothetical protein
MLDALLVKLVAPAKTTVPGGKKDYRSGSLATVSAFTEGGINCQRLDLFAVSF